MAVVKEQPLVHVLVAAIARAVVEHPSVPAENRDAFRAVAPRLIQEIIRQTLGCDSVQLTGWVLAPVERQARRERILSALLSGDKPRAIASRELVSVRLVEKLRKGMTEGERTAGERTAAP